MIIEGMSRSLEGILDALVEDNADREINIGENNIIVKLSNGLTCLLYSAIISARVNIWTYDANGAIIDAVTVARSGMIDKLREIEAMDDIDIASVSREFRNRKEAAFNPKGD